jgi:hypothetical protein
MGCAQQSSVLVTVTSIFQLGAGPACMPSQHALAVHDFVSYCAVGLTWAVGSSAVAALLVTHTHVQYVHRGLQVWCGWSQLLLSRQQRHLESSSQILAAFGRGWCVEGVVALTLISTCRHHCWQALLLLSVPARVMMAACSGS